MIDSETMKYYWILSVCISQTGSELHQEEVTDTHPFLQTAMWQKQEAKSIASRTVQLLNWKEITKEEYDIWQQKEAYMEKFYEELQ